MKRNVVIKGGVVELRMGIFLPDWEKLLACLSQRSPFVNEVLALASEGYETVCS
jgi:hypothetical protein